MGTRRTEEGRHNRSAAIATLLGLGTSLWAWPGRAQSVGSLTIAAVGNDSTTSALYAVTSGMFRKAGLGVNLVPMTSGGAVAAAVAGGAIQIGHSSLMSLIEAHARGVPFTLVAPSGMIDPSDAQSVQLIVRAESPVRGARDLDGKTFGVPALKDFDAIATRAWMDRTGGDSSTVKFVELPPSASLAALVEGRIDATSLATPFLTQALDSGKVRAVGNAFSAVSPRYMELAWFTASDYADQNRETIRRFAAVMRDAAAYCNAHQAQTAGMIAAFTKIDAGVVRRMPRMKFAPYLDAAMIQPLIDVAAQYGAIGKAFRAEELISDLALKPPARQATRKPSGDQRHDG